MGEEVRGEGSRREFESGERARMDGGRVDLTSESEGLPGLLGASG